MGAMISRWRTKPTTVEQLENLDKEIKELEEFRAKNQRLQKLWVGRLLLYSSVLYLLTSLVVYCLYLPEQWLQRLAMALPFFMYPVLVWFIRKFLIFLFSKRTERNNDKLEDLKVAKKKILEEVMETETYKNAKLILERFDPEAKKKAELETTPVRPQMTPRPGQEIRQRGMPMRPMPMGTPAAMAMTPPPGARPLLGPGGTPVAPGGPPERSALSASVLQGTPPRTSCSPIPGVGMHPPGPPLARPILPKDRGAMDRVIEYLVGDGPQNRYTLICQQCFSHNGTALKEEFEYLAKAPAPWNLVHSFQIQQSPKNPQNRPLQSPDEKEFGEDEGHTKEAESGSQSEEEQQQQQQQQQEEEEQEVQVAQEEEAESEHSTPHETESQPS